MDELEEIATEPLELAACQYCSRSFRVERLERHSISCLSRSDRRGSKPFKRIAARRVVPDDDAGAGQASGLIDGSSAASSKEDLLDGAAVPLPTATARPSLPAALSTTAPESGTTDADQPAADGPVEASTDSVRTATEPVRAWTAAATDHTQPRVCDTAPAEAMLDANSASDDRAAARDNDDTPLVGDNPSAAPADIHAAAADDAAPAAAPAEAMLQATPATATVQSLPLPAPATANAQPLLPPAPTPPAEPLPASAGVSVCEAEGTGAPPAPLPAPPPPPPALPPPPIPTPPQSTAPLPLANPPISLEDVPAHPSAATPPPTPTPPASTAPSAAPVQPANPSPSLEDVPAQPSVAAPPPPDDDADTARVSCPHCNRSFAPVPAARHIPKCSTIKAKPTTLRRSSFGGGDRMAQGGTNPSPASPRAVERPAEPGPPAAVPSAARSSSGKKATAQPAPAPTIISAARPSAGRSARSSARSSSGKNAPAEPAPAPAMVSAARSSARSSGRSSARRVVASPGAPTGGVTPVALLAQAPPAAAASAVRSSAGKNASPGTPIGGDTPVAPVAQTAGTRTVKRGSGGKGGSIGTGGAGGGDGDNGRGSCGESGVSGNRCSGSANNDAPAPPTPCDTPPSPALPPPPHPVPSPSAAPSAPPPPSGIDAPAHRPTTCLLSPFLASAPVPSQELPSATDPPIAPPLLSSSSTAADTPPVVPPLPSFPSVSSSAYKTASRQPRRASAGAPRRPRSALPSSTHSAAGGQQLQRAPTSSQNAVGSSAPRSDSHANAIPAAAAVAAAVATTPSSTARDVPPPQGKGGVASAPAAPAAAPVAPVLSGRRQSAPLASRSRGRASQVGASSTTPVGTPRAPVEGASAGRGGSAGNDTLGARCGVNVNSKSMGNMSNGRARPSTPRIAAGEAPVKSQGAAGNAPSTPRIRVGGTPAGGTARISSGSTARISAGGTARISLGSTARTSAEGTHSALRSASTGCVSSVTSAMGVRRTAKPANAACPSSDATGSLSAPTRPGAAAPPSVTIPTRGSGPQTPRAAAPPTAHDPAKEQARRPRIELKRARSTAGDSGDASGAKEGAAARAAGQLPRLRKESLPCRSQPAACPASDPAAASPATGPSPHPVQSRPVAAESSPAATAALQARAAQAADASVAPATPTRKPLHSAYTAPRCQAWAEVPFAKACALAGGASGLQASGTPSRIAPPSPSYQTAKPLPPRAFGTGSARAGAAVNSEAGVQALAWAEGKPGVNAGVNAGVNGGVNAGVSGSVNGGVKAAPNPSELQEVIPVRQFGWRRRSVVTCPASPLLHRGARVEAADHLLSASEMGGCLSAR